MWATAVEGVRDQRHERKGGEDTAVLVPSHVALTLPQLPAQIARKWTVAQGSTKVAKLAQSMLQAGLLKDEVCDDALEVVVCRGLSAWLARSLTGRCKHFRFSAMLHDTVWDVINESHAGRNAEGVQDAIKESFGTDPNQEHLTLVIRSGERVEMSVGKAVCALEASVPGLGFELLRHIETLGMWFGLMGASFMEYAASGLYWGGGESEQDWASEWGEPLESFSGLTREEFDDEYPKGWTKATKMTDASLDMALRHVEARVRKAAKLVKQARGTTFKGEHFSFNSLSSFCEFSRESMDPTVLLTWDRFHNVAYRIGDDYMEGMGGDSEEEPGLGMAVLALDDAGWFARKEREWEGIQQTVQLLDSMIDMVGRQRK